MSLLTLETNHSRNAHCYRFGIVYAQPEQKEEADMFTNRVGSPGFERFLSLLADKVPLVGFNGYTGGLNQEDAQAVREVVGVISGNSQRRAHRCPTRITLYGMDWR